MFAGWPDGHRAAISFSFDDARPSQMTRGLPLLDRLGVAATFFVLPDAVAPIVTGWRHAVASGHEIGNHTTSHPCSGNFAWSRRNALERMTLADFEWEVSEANRRVSALLGVEPRVFAYPCGQSFVGRGRRARSLVPLISHVFDVGRTFNDVVSNSPLEFDPAHTACVNCDGHTVKSLMPALEAAVRDEAWLVLGGHEIDELQDAETTLPSTIKAVVGWCRRNRVWIDTVGNVARTAVRRRQFRTTQRFG